MSIIEALESDNLEALKAIPKTDVHCHALLSTRRKRIERWLQCEIPKPSTKLNGLEGMMEYMNIVLSPYISDIGGFEFVAHSAIEDAIEDGVVIMEMSFDIRLVKFYDNSLDYLRIFIKSLEKYNKRKIDLRPELGISRECIKDPYWMKFARRAIASNTFKSIDLYGHQDACTPEDAVPLFTQAYNANMKLKAHVGEFKDAEEIRRTVEVLNLNEVQHGIAAAESIEVMRWLAENNIQLNVCPTSNIMLDGVSKMSEHPIRVLYDSGVPVTINTDDLLIFDQSVSEEYLNLYRANVLSAEELEDIRLRSLDSSHQSIYNFNYISKITNSEDL